MTKRMLWYILINMIFRTAKDEMFKNVFNIAHCRWTYEICHNKKSIMKKFILQCAMKYVVVGQLLIMYEV